MTDNQKKYISALIAEIGKGASTPSILSLEATLNAVPEDKKKDAMDGIIQGLKTQIRILNVTRPCSDSTYELVRKADALTKQSTEREGLTEAVARQYISKTNIDFGVGKPTQKQKELLFKLLGKANKNKTAEQINAEVSEVKTYGEMSAKLDVLLPKKKNAETVTTPVATPAPAVAQKSTDFDDDMPF